MEDEEILKITFEREKELLKTNLDKEKEKNKEYEQEIVKLRNACELESKKDRARDTTQAIIAAGQARSAVSQAPDTLPQSQVNHQEGNTIQIGS